MRPKSKVLIIAGSDSSGGAGIQADSKTVTSLGCYAMTAITALNARDAEKAVWNAVRAQKYVSHIQEMIQISSPGIDRRNKKKEGTKIQSVGKDDVAANDLIDEFEKLIQIHDSYGAFRRLAAKKLGVPAIKVTIKEINEITKQVHRAYEINPKRRRKDKV